MANVLDRNFDFATNGTVTAAGLHNLIDETNIYAGLISTQEERTTVGTADLLLVADSSSIASPQIAANRTTVYNLFEDALTGGTYVNAQLSGNLTYGTATGNRTVSTSATITTGTIATLNSTTGTIATLNSTTGTIATLNSTTPTFLGAITASTNTINIGSGQIYKDASGNVGIGTASPTAALSLGASKIINWTSNDLDTVRMYTFSNTYGIGTGGSDMVIFAGSGGGTSFKSGSVTGSSLLRIVSSGEVGIGVTSPISSLHIKHATPTSKITLEDSSTNRVGQIAGGSDGAGGLLTFSVGNNGGTITESLRIDSSGNVFVGKTVGNMDVAGSYSEQSGRGRFTTNSGLEVLTLNRQDSDGIIVEIRQANTLEGDISVSGTTVSYNGGHLSRWSQLPSGQRDSAIKKGTVLSNLDAMCEWRDADGNLLPNEQLNKVKISDVESDSNTAGVFVNWDNDDQDNPYDLNMAMTGDMIIRIAQGTIVNRGDLLMSAGDGTAKPQGDDIIRSKTIAKVTSTNVTCTYEDGSYCVPCVLMAC